MLFPCIVALIIPKVYSTKVLSYEYTFLIQSTDYTTIFTDWHLYTQRGRNKQ